MAEPRRPSSRTRDNKSASTPPSSDEYEEGRPSFSSLVIPVLLLGIAFALFHNKQIVSSVTSKCHAFLSMLKNPSASQQDSESMSSSDIITLRNRPPHHLFTEAELSRFDGNPSTHKTHPSSNGKEDVDEDKNANKDNRILLAIAGIVVDVTKGARIYGHGGSYHHFAGRDATRSFASGDFSQDGLRSDLEGLTPQDLRSILHWVVFYANHPSYTIVGRLIGPYYDDNGQTRPCRLDNPEDFRAPVIPYPMCNSRWSSSEGGSVWCSTQSGGVERDWIGVPRLYRTFAEAGDPEQKITAHCVCVPDVATASADTALSQVAFDGVDFSLVESSSDEECVSGDDYENQSGVRSDKATLALSDKSSSTSDTLASHPSRVKMERIFQTDHLNEPIDRKKVALQASFDLIKAIMLSPVSPKSSLYLGGGLLDPFSIIELIKNQKEMRKTSEPHPTQDCVLRMSHDKDDFFWWMHYCMKHSYAAYSVVAKSGKLDDIHSTMYLHTIQPLIDDIRECRDAQENIKAVCELAELQNENIIASYWDPSAFRPCYYLAVDPKNQCVVLSIRGTTHEGDILTDICAETMPLFPELPGDAEENSHFSEKLVDEVAHKGMMHSALYLIDQLWGPLKGVLLKHPEYPVFVTGHSLGGGVAALFSILLMESKRRKYLGSRMKCFVFGPPSIVSYSLGEHCSAYITSVVSGKDVVPRLSMKSMVDLLQALNERSPLRRGIRYIEESFSDVREKIEATIFKIPTKQQPPEAKQTQEPKKAHPWKTWVTATLPFLKETSPKESEAVPERSDDPVLDSPLERSTDEPESGSDDPSAKSVISVENPPVICPPGLILQAFRPMSRHPILIQQHREYFNEIQLSSSMMSDHMPALYLSLTSNFYERSLERPRTSSHKKAPKESTSSE